MIMPRPSPIILISISTGILALTTACGKANSTSANSSDRSAYSPVLSGPNVMLVTLGGTTLCGVKGYDNEPCTSITLCAPGTSNCQTITDILVDTGSVGLRIFSSVITVELTPVIDAASNKPLAQCAQFGSGSDWGPIMLADVGLASEPIVQTPIQVINKLYKTPVAACNSADVSPELTGFNGILGVNVFKQDCGPQCTTNAGNQLYYSCGATSCVGSIVSLANQLQNPVALLPVDNNGVIVEMPLLPDGVATSVTGSLVLGIGTQANNDPTGATRFGTDSYGDLPTTIDGTRYPYSFVDSGSNGLYFPAPSSVTRCSSTSIAPGFYCPSPTVSLTASISSFSGDAQRQINFDVSNALDLFNSSNIASDSLAGEDSNEFDWGLPFFFGRKIYVGIEETFSTLGKGPYQAF